MRWVVVTMLACALALGAGNSAEAKKVPCKKIKEAIASGKTPEQVATEMGTKVHRVEACMSGKKKGKTGDAAATGAPDADDEEAED